MSQSETITLAHREGKKNKNRSAMASPRLWGRIWLMTHLHKSLRNGNLDEADEGDKAKR